jgi:hypothetical protein
MEQQTPTRPSGTQRVHWPAVVSGVVFALVAGLIAGFFAGAFGLSVSGNGPDSMSLSVAPMMACATAAPLLLLGGIWLAWRRAAPGFAKGIVIGGCIAVLGSGLCTALIAQ